MISWYDDAMLQNGSTDFGSSELLHINSCAVPLGDGEREGRDLTIRRPQGRQDYQLIYIWRGSAEYCIRGELCRLEAGTVLLYQPGEPQFYIYREQDHSQVCWMHFSGTLAGPLMERCGLAAQPVLQLGEVPELMNLLHRIIRELQGKNAQYADQVLAYFIQMTTLIGRRRLQLEDGEGYLRAQRIRRAVEYLHAHYDEAMTVETCARLCALSRHHFIRVFREQTGLSPYAYLTQVRMREAAQLLEDTQIPVSQVARRCGYEDELYFSRLFRKKTGMAPTKYRKLHQI